MDDRNKGFESLQDKLHLIELEKSKDKILKDREESWRLKSRALWLQAGDDNTKFFQNYAKESEADLTSPVTSTELEGTLKWFKNDKSPGLDGWSVEFYLVFYDLLGNDLLQVIEECRTIRKLYNAINSTFIALIPKSDSPSSFNNFRPISLCNCLYKIIAKIIANRIRPILSQSISPEQFAFLENRQIH
eukprot:PITA_09518